MTIMLDQIPLTIQRELARTRIDDIALSHNLTGAVNHILMTTNRKKLKKKSFNELCNCFIIYDLCELM